MVVAHRLDSEELGVGIHLRGHRGFSIPDPYRGYGVTFLRENDDVGVVSFIFIAMTVPCRSKPSRHKALHPQKQAASRRDQRQGRRGITSFFRSVSERSHCSSGSHSCPIVRRMPKPPTVW